MGTHQGSSNEYPQSMFWAEMKNIRDFYLKIFSFWRWNFLYIWIGVFCNGVHFHCLLTESMLAEYTDRKGFDRTTLEWADWSEPLLLHKCPFLAVYISLYHSLGWFSQSQLIIFWVFLKKKLGFEISCKLVKNLFSGKNKKNISKCFLLIIFFLAC